MCGRFAQTASIAELIQRFEIEQAICSASAGYNIAPGSEVAVIIIEDKKKLLQFRWGLVPSWTKDPAAAAKLINARAETITQKPSFSASFKKRRCLIVSTGFYEWKKDGKEKIPVYIRMESGEPFCFAGIYDFHTSADGKKTGTCAIVTTRANELIKTVHDRMPVIISRDKEKLWLDCAGDDIQLVLPLLEPRASEGMELYEVSKLVNSPANDSAECIRPAEKKK